MENDLREHVASKPRKGDTLTFKGGEVWEVRNPDVGGEVIVKSNLKLGTHSCNMNYWRHSVMKAELVALAS